MKQPVKRLATSTTTALPASHGNHERVEGLVVGWVASGLLMMTWRRAMRAPSAVAPARRGVSACDLPVSQSELQNPQSVDASAPHQAAVGVVGPVQRAVTFRIVIDAEAADHAGVVIATSYGYADATGVGTPAVG